MSESIVIAEGTKEQKYESLLPQIGAIISGEPDLIANMANSCAALKAQFAWWWVGFYIVRQDQLVLGPFQGPVACTRITSGRGVCGTAWARDQTVMVEDVSQFQGHIACSSASRSEIVLPVHFKGKVIGVLDIDSEQQSCFDAVDQRYLEQFITVLEKSIVSAP